jgi:hypothetical protein
MELIIEVADERELVEHVFVRRALDSDSFQASWYQPHGGGQRQRFNMAVQAAIDWFIDVGCNTPVVLEQVPLWYIGGQYHRPGIQPDEGRPLTYKTEVDPPSEDA